jgi:hypothetical protein
MKTLAAAGHPGLSDSIEPELPLLSSASYSLRSAVIACLAGLLLTLAVVHSSANSDFDQFYAAAKLAGTGHLYDWGAIRQLQTGYKEDPVPFGRLPIYAEMFKVYAALPRVVAQWAWFLTNLAALAGFIVLWPFANSARVLVGLCWSVPVAVGLFCGQDTAMFLLFMAGGMWLLQERRDFAAGLVFSLAANKFHLAMALPIFLIACRRWKALTGGVVGCAAVLGLSFAIEGRDWLGQLAKLSNGPEFTQDLYKMPNLHGLLHDLPFSGVVEFILTIVLLACVYRLARTAPLRVSAAAMLSCGLMIGFHGYVHDAVLLLPLIIVVVEEYSGVLRYWGATLCLPPMYVLLVTPVGSWISRTAIVVFTIVTIAMMSFAPPRDLQNG